MLLQRYILRQLAVSFLFTFMVMISVFSIGVIIQSMRAFGEAWLEYLAETAPTVFVYVSPWALLVACTTSATLVYGRLSADNEIDAVRMSGIHSSRIILPGLFFGVVISILTFVLHQELLPRALFARRNVLKESAVTALRNPPPGRRTLNLGNEGTLSYLDAENGVLRYPVLNLLTDGQLSAHFQGREARILLPPDGPPVIELVDGQFSKYWEQETHGTFGGEPFRVPLPLDKARSRPESPAEMTSSQLGELLDPSNPWSNNPKVRTEYYGRLGRTAAPVALVLIAIPLGMWVKKGSRLAGLGMALPPLLAYIVLMFVFQGFGEKARVSPEVAGLAPAAILAVVAAAFLAQVYRR